MYTFQPSMWYVVEPGRTGPQSSTCRLQLKWKRLQKTWSDLPRVKMRLSQALSSVTSAFAHVIPDLSWAEAVVAVVIILRGRRGESIAIGGCSISED